MSRTLNTLEKTALKADTLASEVSFYNDTFLPLVQFPCALLGSFDAVPHADSLRKLAAAISATRTMNRFFGGVNSYSWFLSINESDQTVNMLRKIQGSLVVFVIVDATSTYNSR